MKWTREQPESPSKKPSKWYWFLFDGEEEPVVVEVWPKRAIWMEGLWGPEVPYEEPPKLKRKEKKSRCVNQQV